MEALAGVLAAAYPELHGVHGDTLWPRPRQFAVDDERRQRVDPVRDELAVKVRVTPTLAMASEVPVGTFGLRPCSAAGLTVGRAGGDNRQSVTDFASCEQVLAGPRLPLPRLQLRGALHAVVSVCCDVVCRGSTSANRCGESPLSGMQRHRCRRCGGLPYQRLRITRLPACAGFGQVGTYTRRR